MKPICIYHGNCADGFTAAWAVWRAHPDWEFYPGIYQNPPPEVTGRDVVFVDFSYKRAVVAEMIQKARSILILDHHKSAAEDFAQPDPGVMAVVDLTAFTGALTWERHMQNVAQDQCEGALYTVYALFDMERSGAGIAWDFFHPGEARPKLVNYVEDRDLGRVWTGKGLPKSREINAWVFSHPYAFEQWNDLNYQLDTQFDAVTREGEAIERKHHKDVAELVQAFMRPLRIGGHDVPAANLPYTLTSDAGHLMCEGIPDPNGPPDARLRPPFAACYWHTPEGVVFSLRSIEGGMDVSEIAAQYGGGGHRHAAGFRVSFADAAQFESA